MPFDPGAPAEMGGGQPAAPPPQILVNLMSHDDSNQIPGPNSVGASQVSPSTQENAGNCDSDVPAEAVGEDESLLGDFIGVSSLQHVNITKLGLPPLNFLTQGIIFALLRASEHACGAGYCMKQEAAKKVLNALRTASPGCRALEDGMARHLSSVYIRDYARFTQKLKKEGRSAALDYLSQVGMIQQFLPAGAHDGRGAGRLRGPT